MKKVLLTIILLGFVNIVSYSQTFTFHRIKTQTVIGDTANGATTKGALMNTGTTTLRFKYVRILKIYPDSTWSSSMCGAGQCYGSNVDTVPPFFAHQNFQLAPGESDTLSVDVSGKTVGFATIVVKAFVTSNPSGAIVDTFRVQLVPFIGISQINEIVQDYNLKQNYPNPFNPTTSINFSLPENSKVSLIVYNIEGKEVAKLMNNQAFNGGSYKYDFNADDYGLSSGVYFYQLITSKYQKTLKMVLIK
jgi:hypothetical protein